MPRGGLARLIAAALGGALLACALPVPGWWPLGWIGLAPMILAANASERPREAAWAGLSAGLAYHAVVLHWVYLTCRFARVPAAVSAAAWLALAAFLALNWAAAAALARVLTGRVPRAWRPLLWAAAWTAVAAATERWTPRLAVDLLAYTQWPNLALLQAGSWGGPHLLGFSVCLANAALAEAWLDAPEARRDAVPAFAAALALAGGLWGHGALVLLGRPAGRGSSARLEILQPNIEQYQKWDKAAFEGVLSGYDALLALPRTAAPALVIWPETAIPRWTRRSAAAPEAARWATRLAAPQLVGIVADPEDGEGAANAVQLIGGDGRVAGAYAKRELVPFGEFVPLRDRIPRFVIDRWLAVLDQLGDMTRGSLEQPLLRTPWGATSVTICYEAMFPRLIRRDAARGASLLVNVTNDGWYLDTWAPYQHFQANVFRAIESRATLVRSGNTGISAVIDPWGVVLARLPLNERGRLDADVPLADPFPRRSLYARRGDWLGAGCLALTALLALAAIAARRA